jgi:activin receptor type-1
MSSNYLLKLSAAIFGPVLLFTIVAFITIFFIRRNHRKRLMQSRNKQDPETYYATEDLLRVTSAGDSTLRVISTSSF